jgi:hypothetical protein
MRARAAVLVGVVMAGAAQAAPGRPPADPALAALEDAATECFAKGIRTSPRAVSLARAGRWYEAAGLTASLCRPEVGAMVRRRDALTGYGSGHRYFTGPYVKALEKALASRVRPVLEATAGEKP